jgi:hypothetical protein
MRSEERMTWVEAKDGAVNARREDSPKAKRKTSLRSEATAAVFAQDVHGECATQRGATEQLQRTIADLVTACGARLRAEQPANLTVADSTDDQERMLDSLERRCFQAVEALATAHTDSTRRQLAEQQRTFETKLETQRTASDVALKQEALAAEDKAMRRMSASIGAGDGHAEGNAEGLLLKRLDEVQAKLAKREVEIERTRETLEETNASLNGYVAELTETKAHAAELEIVARESAARAQAAEEEAQFERAAAEQYLSGQRALLAFLSVVRQKRRNALTRCAEAEASLAVALSEQTRLTAALATAEEAEAQAKQAAQEAMEAREAAEKALTEQTARAEAAEARADHAEAAAAQAREMAAAAAAVAAAEAEAARREFARLQEAYDACKEQLDAAEALAAAARARIERLELEAAELTKQVTIWARERICHPPWHILAHPTHSPVVLPGLAPGLASPPRTARTGRSRRNVLRRKRRRRTQRRQRSARHAAPPRSVRSGSSSRRRDRSSILRDRSSILGEWSSRSRDRISIACEWRRNARRRNVPSSSKSVPRARESLPRRWRSSCRCRRCLRMTVRTSG